MPEAATDENLTGEWGLVWLVDDDPQQRAMCLDSYRSACRWMPAVPKLIWHTAEPLGIECLQRPLETPSTKWAAKFDAWAQSPFQTTVFLDNDTFVLRDMEPVVRRNRSVTALPYPNRLRRDMVPEEAQDGLPRDWQNVNSGVVVFHRSFMDHYRRYWDRLQPYANRVPGKDQYVFSLALHELSEPWQRCWNLQVSTTRFALEWLRRLWGVDHEPAMGRVPLALLYQAYTFHATADKAEYHGLFKQWFQADRLHRAVSPEMMDRHAETLPESDFRDGVDFAPHDQRAALAR